MTCLIDVTTRQCYIRKQMANGKTHPGLLVATFLDLEHGDTIISITNNTPITELIMSVAIHQCQSINLTRGKHYIS